MIHVGDTIPSIEITTTTTEESIRTTTHELFANKKAVLFAVPGAFTPTCSRSHLPGFISLFDSFKAKGVDVIACLSVNDSFVMQAWAKDQHAEAITMIADGSGTLTKAFGMEMDTGDFGGTRSRRYAMIIDNNVTTLINVEEPKAFEVSDAETILASL